MKCKLSTLLLCVAMLMPSVASAQFFSKQKVVVWEITDRNNDVKVNPTTKQQIRTSMVEAFVNSRNYETFEVNKDDVLSRCPSHRPGAIAKTIGEMFGVNYVIFTTIQIIEHSNSYENYRVHLASDLISTETQKSERVYYVDMKSDINEIPKACAQLMSGLIGEELSVAQPSYQQTPQYSSRVTSSSFARSNVEVVFGYLKVFPNELGEFPSAPKTVIEQINKQAMHDYDTWRLPTDEEIALIKANGLAGSGNYMTSSTSSSKGVVLLVTDATETHSEKEARQHIMYSGMGDNGVYKVGYIYDRGGQKGVVFEVSDGGKHGKIVSISSTQSNWHNAGAWCRIWGSGWYLPSIDELRAINGQTTTINATLSANGYTTLSGWHWSSTESSSNYAYIINFSDGGSYYYYKSYPITMCVLSSLFN